MKQKILALIEVTTAELIAKHAKGDISEADCFELGCQLKSLKFVVSDIDPQTHHGKETLALAADYLNEFRANGE